MAFGVYEDYLIEQLQYKEDETPKINHKINFNHPVKELIWVMPNKEYGAKYNSSSQNIDATNNNIDHRNDYFNYNAKETNSFVEYKYASSRSR